MKKMMIVALVVSVFACEKKEDDAAAKPAKEAAAKPVPAKAAAKAEPVAKVSAEEDFKARFISFLESKKAEDFLALQSQEMKAKYKKRQEETDADPEKAKVMAEMATKFGAPEGASFVEIMAAGWIKGAGTVDGVRQSKVELKEEDGRKFITFVGLQGPDGTPLTVTVTDEGGTLMIDEL